ncbi:MAG: hypothetical protein CL584_13945 [Alteromonadaceae bacterium]|nr:hypothetical protein [Alteromonadaceae bacterium]|tara:strand:+ start:11791 stop:12096 length:306 start_codon:yes stop_codon:yes gene_type:complete
MSGNESRRRLALVSIFFDRLQRASNYEQCDSNCGARYLTKQSNPKRVAIGRSIHCNHAGKSELRAPIGYILALCAGRYIFLAGNLYGLRLRIAQHENQASQ